MRDGEIDFRTKREEVQTDEFKALSERRKAAKLLDENLSDETIEAGLRNRAGLALSGGGVRSASFNLGVVQSFYRSGLLRQFDYLSTVSGGGYLAALIASMACLKAAPADGERPDGERPDGEAAAKTQAGIGSNGVAPSNAAEPTNARTSSDTPLDLTHANPHEQGDCLRPRPSGKQPREIRRLIRCGRYLFRPLEAVNRFAFGIMGINLMILCGLASVAAFAAFLFRIWDDQEMLVLDDFPQAFGFSGDVRRAFFWSAILGVSWLVIWAGKQKTWSLNPNGGHELWTDAAKWVFAATSLVLAAMLIVFTGAAFDVFSRWTPLIALCCLSVIVFAIYLWFEYSSLKRLWPRRRKPEKGEADRKTLPAPAVVSWLAGAFAVIAGFTGMGWLVGPATSRCSSNDASGGGPPPASNPSRIEFTFGSCWG
ncbi:MAG: hypothetical protein H0T47_01960 [Planctomycetaceae bacterium]|nr:hypothetical protein [Planctomycetaceae bacterium]